MGTLIEFLVLPKRANYYTDERTSTLFPLFSEKTGELMPMFITVRNGNDYNLAVIAHGNARVLELDLVMQVSFLTKIASKS